MGLDRLIYNAIRKGNIELAKFDDDIPLYFGSSKDISAEWDGSKLEILPLTDDVGSINIGNGTKDIDFKVFLGTATAYALFDVGNARVALMGDARVILGTSTSDRNSYAAAGDIIQMFTKNMATSGICTGLDFEHSAGYQGSTSIQVTAIRGVLRVLTGTTHTAGYNDACAGYWKNEGTINGTGCYYGVRGVILDGGTWTACTEVAAGCFEYNNAQTVSSGKTAILALKNNTSPAKTIDNMIYCYNGQAITYAMEFSHIGTAPVTTAVDSTNVTHKIAVKLGAIVGYLHVFSD